MSINAAAIQKILFLSLKSFLLSRYPYHYLPVCGKIWSFLRETTAAFFSPVRDPCQHNAGNHWSSSQAEQILTDRFLSLRAASFGPNCSQWAETGLRSFCLRSKLSPESIWLRPPNFLGIN